MNLFECRPMFPPLTGPCSPTEVPPCPLDLVPFGHPRPRIVIPLGAYHVDQEALRRARTQVPTGQYHS